MSNIQEYVPQEQDRVAVIRDGKIQKGRIAQVFGPNGVLVTCHKDDAGVTYEKGEVFPLYRYAPTPLGTVAVALCVGVPKQQGE